ncbi:MAG: SMP-30/gluconolactonase/LRE family protein [Vicinamibacterales bacterium]|jgi:gluconolactonase|nr:gluconolactonase [Acidobacteriota bacterium]MDP6372269.1 SMP-30/gluconolactonase/LRE family protein [Vicinamibacterales bacterium]MDP6610082.1 SMP-30/gluconolactonase/LRE family protein [Vicinamibacterales bacterium]HAK54740.1 gluconolactonase [Acidobacteriota bacterium]|tara:strand:- start:2509 stop:3510 length:1002 start_codon:yes stop_codon:yes gene_type:complete
MTTLRSPVLPAAAALLLSACAAEAPAPGETDAVVPAAPARQVDVATTVAFTEGPTVDEAGNVYFTDFPNNRIMRLSTEGALTTFRQPSHGANGLIFDNEWRLLACEAGDGDMILPRITRTNIETGEVEVLADDYEGLQLHQPNDVTIDGSGRVYFTDRPGPNPRADQTGVHGVYRIDPDGTIERILTEPEIERPNGLVISPDDRTFYLIEAAGNEGGARMIRAYDLADDGTVGNMRVFHDFYPGRSGDGMTIDAEGNLWVAAGLNRLRGSSETLDTPAGVHVFAPDGELVEFIPIPEDTVTNVAFGGPDLSTLYVTAGKTLFRVETDVTGTRR